MCLGNFKNGTKSHVSDIREILEIINRLLI